MRGRKTLKAWQRFLLLIGLFAAFEALYQLLLYFERTYFPQTPVCILLLGAAVGGLLVSIIILNRGFDNKPVTTDMLDFTLPYEERVKRAEKINKNKKTAKKLMNIFIPLAFVFCIDLIDLYFDIFDKIKGLFG